MASRQAVRVLGAAILAGFVSLATVAPSSADPPSAEYAHYVCDDGLGDARIVLNADTDQDTVFTTRVDGNQPFEDKSRTVAAGQQFTLTVPDLFYGGYQVRVFADGDQVLFSSFFVKCVPTKPYTRSGAGTVRHCDDTITYVVQNEPVPGAEDLLDSVHFVITARTTHGGFVTLLETDLPDKDSTPYSASITVRAGHYHQVRITADGEAPKTSWSGGPSCAADPEPDPPELPNTGA